MVFAGNAWGRGGGALLLSLKVALAACAVTVSTSATPATTAALGKLGSRDTEPLIQCKPSFTIVCVLEASVGRLNWTMPLVINPFVSSVPKDSKPNAVQLVSVL